jgi:hypothetical protein
MGQSHDLYEPVRCQPANATPEPRVVIQCHDLYPDPGGDGPQKGEQPQAEESVVRQPARV